ncbi:MAG TPA: hypothetical protein ENK06_13115 [Gammaproteobacteria bacterium]|nr:hypothetical protein [Gammaproteobacteria bacterium]
MKALNTRSIKNTVRKKANPNDPKDPAWEPTRNRVKELLETRQVTRKQIIDESDVNSTVLSRFLATEYPGRNDTVCEALEAWMATRLRREEAKRCLPNEPDFLHTVTAGKIIDTLTYAHMANDICLIYGGAGVGKTKTFRQYVIDNVGVCLATMTALRQSPKLALEEVGKCLGIRNTKSSALLFDLICESLYEKRGLLIIDEAQHLSIKALDILRQVHDSTGCGLVLAGNEQVYTNITGGSRALFLDRLFSRIGMRTRLKKTLTSDVHQFAHAWGIRNDDVIAILDTIAKKPGALRLVNKVLRNASLISGGEAIEAKHVRASWKRLAEDS